MLLTAPHRAAGNESPKSHLINGKYVVFHRIHGVDLSGFIHTILIRNYPRI